MGTKITTVVYVFGFLAVAGLWLSCEGSDSVSNLDQYYFPLEDECNKAGGICIAKSECPKTKLSETGTCPNSASKGAACCHGVPKSETRCQKYGGECTAEYCSKTLIKTEATDCTNNTKCCIRVN